MHYLFPGVEEELLGRPIKGQESNHPHPLSMKSVIVTRHDHITALMEWLPGKTFQLLYHASRDGWDSNTFHSRCDDKGPTVVVIQAHGGRIFGGYSDQSWRSETGRLMYRTSHHAFLFSLTNGSGGSPIKFPMKAPGSPVIYCEPGCGPGFGVASEVSALGAFGHLTTPGTWDLVLDPSYAFTGSAICLSFPGNAFSPPHPACRRPQAFLTGNAFTMVSDYEVFKVK